MAEGDNGAIAHPAGSPVFANNGVTRQRCAWCGVVLVEFDTKERMGQVPFTWEEHSFVILTQTDPPIGRAVLIAEIEDGVSCINLEMEERP